MSKYDEICKAYSEFRQKCIDYKEECWRFISILFSEFKDYTKIPNNYFKFIPAEGDYDENTSYSLMGAMSLSKDGFYQFGILISIFEHPNIEPHLNFSIRIGIRKQGDKYQVTVGPGFDKTSNFDSEQEKKELFEYILKTIQDALKFSPENLKEDFSVTKKIGF